jgi:hypothetical protein
VAKVSGDRRVVYPIPRSPDLTWVQARVYPQRGTVTCWADTDAEGSAFGPCEIPQGEAIDGSHHSMVRLMIQPSDQA